MPCFIHHEKILLMLNYLYSSNTFSKHIGMATLLLDLPHLASGGLSINDIVNL